MVMKKKALAEVSQKKALEICLSFSSNPNNQ
jgi:hypothetical protein